MTRIDFTPLYRSSVGFDRLASILDHSMRNENAGGGYPPYNIEVQEENHYRITLAVAGFNRDELDIHVEKGVLTIRGKKEPEQSDRQFLYQGIANRSFERKFNLADYVEVREAGLDNGILAIQLVKEIPEAMKPKTIPIGASKPALHQTVDDTEVQ